MLVFKILGLVMILISCSLFGFLKSFSLKKRVEKLQKICVSMETFENLIKSGTLEFNDLIEMSFEKDTVYICNKLPVVNKSGLLNEETELLQTFLSKAGMSDINSECSRISIYKSLLKKTLASAEDRMGQYSKLYNTLGVLTGLAICIFLV